MNRFLLLPFLLVVLHTTAFAQLTAPDSVCLNQSFTASAPAGAQTYTWLPTGLTLGTPANAVTIPTNNNLSVSTFAVMYNDSGNYYAFVSKASTHQLWRLSFGTNPYSTPVITSLGNLSGALVNETQGIELVKDGGSWFGLVADGTNLVRLNFGNSLNNTPTATVMSFPAHLFYTMQVTLKKYNNQWIAFTGSFSGGRVSRFNFGSSLTNTPTAHSFPTIQTPCYFTLHQEGAAWHMLATNLIDDEITRFDFGTNLLNDNPTITNIGNPGNLLNLPRGIVMMKNCDSLQAIVVNEAGNFTKLHFGNSITNTPTATNLGTLQAPNLMQSLHAFWYNNTLNLLSVNFNQNSTLIRVPVLTLPAGAATTSQPSHSFSYTTSGAKSFVLATDMAMQSGTATYCKNITVVDSLQPTITVNGNVLTASAGFVSYQWYLNGTAINGATSATYTPTGSGLYSVRVTNSGGCSGMATGLQYTGINDARHAAGVVAVYPNPASGVVNLRLDNLSGAVNLSCYNSLGALVLTKQIGAGAVDARVNVSALPAGVYILRIETAKGVAMTPVALQ